MHAARAGASTDAAVSMVLIDTSRPGMTMLKFASVAIALVASLAYALQVQVYAVAPERVEAGEAFSVQVFATMDGFGSSAAIAGFGLDVQSSGNTAAVQLLGEPAYGVFSVGTLADRVQGTGLVRVVGGQLPNAFGLNPGVVTDTTVLLFSFEVQTDASGVGTSVSFTPAVAANGGVVVYASSLGTANSPAVVADVAGVTVELISACLGDIADDFGFTLLDGGGPDGVVDFGDFVALLGLIGPCSNGQPGCLGDIADDFGFTATDGGGPDGVVDFGDFVALLGLIGPCD